MKIAFTTCVQLGLSCIEEIYKIGGQLDLMITLKDEQAREKSGRIYLDDFAEKYHIPLLKIKNINDQEALAAIKEHDIDWLFIIGWSQIAKKEILNSPKKGCIGMHPTLLPNGRGRAAIPWAIIKGLKQTGVTMFKLDEGVDTGEIISQGVIPLQENITATELYDEVDAMHVRLLAEQWQDIINNRITLTKQDNSQATEWPGRKPEDGAITAEMTMLEADRMVRAVTHPYPGAFYQTGEQTYRIWSATVNKDKGMLKLKDGFLIPLDFEIDK